jgi:hypothetical protein
VSVRRARVNDEFPLRVSRAFLAKTKFVIDPRADSARFVVRRSEAAVGGFHLKKEKTLWLPLNSLINA